MAMPASSATSRGGGRSPSPADRHDPWQPAIDGTGRIDGPRCPAFSGTDLPSPRRCVSSQCGGTQRTALQPHAPGLGAIGASLAIRLWHVLLGLPLLLTVPALAGIALGAGDVAVALPALALAAALRFLFTYSLALSALWTERAHGVVGLGETLIFLLGGEAAPVPLLPDAVRPWVAALPFRAMLGFPAEVASGSLDATEVLTGYAWQVLWIVLVATGATIVWRRGVRRYVAIGS
jgi:ABC-2 type transport system permease protein